MFQTGKYGGWPYVLWLVVTILAHNAWAQSDGDGVAALGRLEPEGGIVHVTAPSTPLSLAGSVIAELHVEEGDDVERGQLLGVSDAAPALQAAVALAEASLERERLAAASSASTADEICVRASVVSREADRRESLLERELASIEEVEQSRGDAEAQSAACEAALASARVAQAAIDVAAKQLALREAELERAFVRAPFSGRVLKIVAKPGEYVGADGFLELGRVSRMLAIAEVYETDIREVRVGQLARVNSDVLDAPLSGRVQFIRPKVAKQDEIGTDPAARKDARIIEVGVLLDDPNPVKALTNLQVEVIIDT